MILIDIIGYVGALLVLASFLFKDLKKVRVTNCFGCVFSIIYGVATATVPTALLNIGLLVINVIMLIFTYSNAKGGKNK